MTAGRTPSTRPSPRRHGSWTHTLHAAITAPPRRLHGRRLAWFPTSHRPGRARCVPASGPGAMELRLDTLCRPPPPRGQQARGMKRLLALGAGTLAALVLFPLLLAASPASASTLSDCLARQHVCVTGEGRSLVSAGQ